MQLATAFVAKVFCHDVDFEGGGTWVPRCFMTLKQVGGGINIENSAVLAQGHESTVVLTAPQSPWLPAAVVYDLTVTFNVRSSYSGTKNPKGSVDATITSLDSYFAFPTAAEGAPELAAAPARAAEGENGALDRNELARALADLERNAKFERVQRK